MRINVAVDGGVNVVFGPFIPDCVVCIGVAVGGGFFLDEFGNGVIEVGGRFVPVDRNRFGVVADDDLHGGMNRVLGVPVHVETGDKRQEAGAGKGEVSAVRRFFGIWRLASRQI